jgi:hypothetical protein
MINITLNKLKYRNPNYRVLKRGSAFGGLGGPIDPRDEHNDGTRVFMAGRFSSKTANAGKGLKAVPIRPRKRAYGPF